MNCAYVTSSDLWVRPTFEQMFAAEYVNQAEAGGSGGRSDFHNPNYEDSSPFWGSSSPPFPQEYRKTGPRAQEGPEYLNTAQNSLPRVASLDNPDYRADFLPPPEPPDALFLPAAQNHEYLGLAAAMQTSAY